VTPAQHAIEEALLELDRLKKVLHRLKSKQISSDDHRRTAKATALTWFHTHRPAVAAIASDESLQGLDRIYQDLISYSARATVRTRYVSLMRAGRANLIQFQTQHALELSGTSTRAALNHDDVPTFKPVVSDSKMQAILVRRWNECVATIGAGAPLSATVMMGGLLEALLLARINKLPDKSVVLNARTAPKDPKSHKVLDIRDWMLRSYIDVAHELKWISTSAKDVGVVLRDYRNYIHPQKEYSHGIVLTLEDANILWEVAKSIIRQLLIATA